MSSILRRLAGIVAGPLYRIGREIIDDPYARLAGRYGKAVRLSNDCRFVGVEGIRIGDYVYIGPYAFMSGSGGLTIGNNIAIGPHVTIYTSDHRYEGADYVPYDGTVIKAPVTIEDHVWIGGNAIILPGMTVGRGAVVGAGSVVAKDVEPCTVVVGNPAKVIKYRDRERFERLVREGKLWLQASVGKATDG